MLMISFVATATNIAVPSLEKAFDAPLSSVSWVVTAYNVCHVTLMLVGGRLADRLGRKRMFLVGLTLFSIWFCVWTHRLFNVLSAAGWRSVFALAIPIALASTVLALRHIPETKPAVAPGPPDVLAAIAGTLAVGGFAIALVQDRTHGDALNLGP
jgi:MFS family permease